jgi:hypothetical protein
MWTLFILLDAGIATCWVYFEGATNNSSSKCIKILNLQMIMWTLIFSMYYLFEVHKPITGTL